MINPFWQENLRQLGEFITAQRAVNQLPRRELARLADLSYTYLNQLKRGDMSPIWAACCARWPTVS